MANDIIEVDCGDNEIVIQSNSGHPPISMQLYQDIYNQITGKTEELSISSKKLIKASIKDVEQLNTKIKQLLEQYTLISANSSFTVFYDNGEKESFSSIEKLNTINSSNSACTEGILIEYNIAIRLPQLARAQSYTVKIRINNQIAVQKKLLAELPPGVPRGLVNSIASKTFEAKITYVDYVVAKTISGTIKDWLESLDEAQENKIITFLKTKSHFFPVTFKLSTLLFCSLTLIFLMPELVGRSPRIDQLGVLLVSCFLFLFFSYKLSWWLGKFVENSIDSTCECSFLKITRGDEKHIESESSENRNAAIKSVIGAVVTFALNFGAKYLAIHLKI